MWQNKIFTVFMSMKHIHLYCNICKKTTNCGSTTFGRWHLQKYHPEYNTKRYYDEFNKNSNEGFCETCSGETKYFSFNKGYLRHCSKKCISNNQTVKIKLKKTKLLKYGSLNNYRKINETILERYGVENISQLPDIKERKKETLIKNFGVDNPLKSEEIKQKQKKSLIRKYGVDNASKLDWVIEKKRKTMLKKYGSDNFSKTRIYREYQETNGLWIKEINKTEFQIYFKKVWNITKKLREKLFFNWNGKCYYSDLTLDRKLPYNDLHYPVIDHKISIFNGFKNSIKPEIIGEILNLCICSREINNKKGIKNEKEFKENL